jgi:hypothetical protein
MLIKYLLLGTICASVEMISLFVIFLLVPRQQGLVLNDWE